MTNVISVDPSSSHLPDHQLPIQTLLTGQHKQSRRLGLQEVLRQVKIPFCKAAFIVISLI
jgi:hypothetical protein